MPNFKIINNQNEIKLNNKWTIPNKFNSKDRLVNEKGEQISVDYQGHQYRIIEKREYIFSNIERIKRGLLGTLATVCTLCLALFSKSTRNLFTKSKKNIRFGILKPSTPTPNNTISFPGSADSSKAPNVSSDPFFDETIQPTTTQVSQKRDETALNLNSNDELVYKNPSLLYLGADISKDQEVNFAKIIINHQPKLMPVIGSRLTGEYTPYNGSASEVLLKISQARNFSTKFGKCEHSGAPIKHFLNHPNNSQINKKEFLEFLLAKDEAGTPRICTLNAPSTLEALNTLKKENIAINLQEKTAKGETLFTIWAGRGEEKLTKAMLELDPSVILQTQNQGSSTFVNAALGCFKNEAELLLNAMENQHLELSKEERWIKIAFQNDLNFSDEEFTNLDHELKIKTFFIANAFNNIDVVKKLKYLGMETVPLFRPGPDIFAENMDILTTRATLENFLKDLRQQKLLLTENEFAQIQQINPHDKGFEGKTFWELIKMKEFKTSYISKSNQIHRIQGKKFIENVVKENGLKHIKVPKKIAVVKNGVNEIILKRHESYGILPQEDQIKVYAEKVKWVDRKLSLDEAIEFMIVLEKTGYRDITNANFMFAEDGIYFIDTEFSDFHPNTPLFHAIKSIASVVDPKDVPKFLEEFDRREKAYKETEKHREEEQTSYKKYFETPFTKLSDGYKYENFYFKREEILTPLT